MLKKHFLETFSAVLLNQFSTNAHTEYWLIVPILCNQLLLDPILYTFNTLQLSYKYIKDVHEEVLCRKNKF